MTAFTAVSKAPAIPGCDGSILRLFTLASLFWVVFSKATFEGPLMALKPVDSPSHFTDWTIAPSTRLGRLHRLRCAV